jgi:hypothetical protein
MTGRMKAAATDDSGASLIFALFLITTIALVSTATLAFADTSIRSTVSMRAVSSTEYAGDAAGEIAVNQLRRAQFNGVATGCDTSTTEVLSNLYPATGTAPAASAAVTCTPSTANGVGGGSNSSPGSALLTLATGTEKGILVDDGNSGSVKVGGGIFSNSTINLAGTNASLESTDASSYAYAMGGCALSGTSQLIVAATSVKNCNYSSDPSAATNRNGQDPGTVTGHGLSFDPPTSTGAVATVPACTGKKVYQLQPGVYTSADALNALTGADATCKGSVIHLNPGSYFFNFPAGSPAWIVYQAFVIGGTATKTLATSPLPTMPGSCVKPDSSAATTSSGVELFFGGLSRLYLSGTGVSAADGNGNIELCASNKASGPPVVIYGLKTAVGSVPAQSGCISALGYGDTAVNDSSHCPVIGADTQPYSMLALWGTTYVPAAGVELTLNNNTDQVFEWGLLARLVRLHATAAADLSLPVIDVPDDADAPFPTAAQRYLSVYVCPGSSTCSASTGKLRLRASVILGTQTPTTVNVTSWATVR